MDAKEVLLHWAQNGTGGLLPAMAGGMILLGIMLLACVIALLRRKKNGEKHSVEEAVRQMLDEQSRRDAEQAETQRAQMEARMNETGERMARLADELSRMQQGQLDALGGQLRSIQRQDEERFGRLQSSVEQRLGGMAESMTRRISESQTQVQTLCEAMDANFRRTGEENARQLDQLKHMLEERLSASADRRLEASFASVEKRLDEVTRGLTDMRTLAGSVEELRVVLSSGAPLGGWGEVQLGTLLSQMLAPEQYARHVRVCPEREDTVDYAVVMPGDGRTVMLPIDASLPMREYQELLTARQSGTRAEMESARSLLEIAVRMHARRVSERVIAEPYTTDYAVLFLPGEGLFAEVLQLPGLAARIQQESHMVIAGPTTFAALLSSLQMGFKSMAIRQRTQEITALLSAVREDLDGFAGSLSRTQRRLRQASESIETAQRHSEQIARRLQDAQALPETDAKAGAAAAEHTADAFDEDEDDPWD